MNDAYIPLRSCLFIIGENQHQRTVADTLYIQVAHVSRATRDRCRHYCAPFFGSQLVVFWVSFVVELRHSERRFKTWEKTTRQRTLGNVGELADKRVCVTPQILFYKSWVCLWVIFL